MKSLFYVSLILIISLSIAKCQDYEEESEELEPVTVDTSDSYDDSEDTTASDLDLIPPLNDKSNSPKPRKPISVSPRSSNQPKRSRGFHDIPTDLRALATDIHEGTTGLIGKAREDLVTRMVLLQDRLLKRQQNIAQRFQSGFGSILGGLGGGVDRDESDV